MAYKLPKPRVPGTKNQEFEQLSKRLVSVAGLAGGDIVNQENQKLGEVYDLVFRWDAAEPYPPLSGLIALVGRRQVWVHAENVNQISSTKVELKTARLDLRDFKPREGEVRLVTEVLDHQLIDVDGARVVRASDLYIAPLGGHIRLVGVDVSFRSLLRRLGPRRLRVKPTPEAVIDWATIQSFGMQSTFKGDLKLASHRHELRRMRPGELADLLEDLSRDERQELLSALSTGQAADALEEMEPQEVEAILRESSREKAAEYLSKMQPDEAADALRDVDELLRQELISNMTPHSAEHVTEILAHDEETAGGLMNTAILLAETFQTPQDVRRKLEESKADPKEVTSVVVVDSDGKLLHDLALVELLLADPEVKLDSLIKPPAPVTVLPSASVKETAERLVENRRTSILVADEQGRPLGRIFADDLVDTMLPGLGRFHFPRLLS